MKRNNRTYILSVNLTQMKELGFKYDYEIQDYIYKFPVYKSKKNEPLIFCRLGVDEETKQIYFNVCNVDGTLYAAFYNRYYGKSKVIKVIDKNIKKEFKKLGVQEKWVKRLKDILTKKNGLAD